VTIREAEKTREVTKGFAKEVEQFRGVGEELSDETRESKGGYIYAGRGVQGKEILRRGRTVIERRVKKKLVRKRRGEDRGLKRRNFGKHRS